VPHYIVEGLREKFGAEEIHVITTPELLPGKQVKITAGAFFGLEAVVTQVLPAKERVKVLLEFLGRMTETELPKSEVVLLDAVKQDLIATQLFDAKQKKR
jgi:transcriptional antiterminator RfaH